MISKTGKRAAHRQQVWSRLAPSLCYHSGSVHIMLKGQNVSRVRSACGYYSVNKVVPSLSAKICAHLYQEGIRMGKKRPRKLHVGTSFYPFTLTYTCTSRHPLRLLPQCPSGAPSKALHNEDYNETSADEHSL